MRNDGSHTFVKLLYLGGSHTFVKLLCLGGCSSVQPCDKTNMYWRSIKHELSSAMRAYEAALANWQQLPRLPQPFIRSREL